MVKKLFNLDHETGIRTDFIADESNDTFTLETSMDVAPLLNQNKELYNTAPSKWGDGQRVASIPLNVYADLQAKGITQDQKRFKAWLNDPDNRYFRTRPGAV